MSAPAKARTGAGVEAGVEAGPEAGVEAPVAGRVARVSGCISVRNLALCVAWYERVLGLETVVQQDLPDLDARLAFLARGSIRLELVQVTGSLWASRPDPPRHGEVRGISQLTFWVDDLEAVLRRTTEQGVRPAMPPRAVPELGLRAFFLRDCENNLLEFLEADPAGPLGRIPAEDVR